MVIASADAHDVHDAALRNKSEANKRLWHVEDPVQKCSKDSDWTQFVSLGGSVNAVNFSVVVILFLGILHFQSHIGRRIGSSHMFLSNHRTGKEYISLRCMTKLYQHFQSSFHSSLTLWVCVRDSACPQNQQTCWDLGPPLVLKRNRDKLRKQIGRIGETGIASLLRVTFPGFQKVRLTVLTAKPVLNNLLL